MDLGKQDCTIPVGENPENQPVSGDAAAAQPGEPLNGPTVSPAPPAEATAEPSDNPPPPQGEGVDAPSTPSAGDAAGDAATVAANESAPAIAARTLMGDMRDFVLELVRDLREPFHKLTENQQAYYVQRVQDRCAGLATEAINTLAAHEFTAIPVLLEQVAFKPKGIETKMSLAAISKAVRHALVDAQGQPVLIVVADPKQFLGARGPARIDRQALFDAKPRDPEEGQPIGPLFEGAPDAGEGGDLGEAATVGPAALDPAADGITVQTVDELDDYNRRVREVAYTEGRHDAKSSRPIVTNPYTKPDVRACYEAGWLDEQLVGLADDKRQLAKSRKAAEKHFREMGRDAAADGWTAADNPLTSLPIEWPGKAWAEGNDGVMAAAAQLAKSDAAAAAEREAVAP